MKLGNVFKPPKFAIGLQWSLLPSNPTTPAVGLGVVTTFLLSVVVVTSTLGGLVGRMVEVTEVVTVVVVVVVLLVVEGVVMGTLWSLPELDPGLSVTRMGFRTIRVEAVVVVATLPEFLDTPESNFLIPARFLAPRCSLSPSEFLGFRLSEFPVFPFFRSMSHGGREGCFPADPDVPD